MTPLLTTSQACERWHVSRGTLAVMRERGIIKAVNINPRGERAVWRYADRLEVVGVANLEVEMLWQDLERRCGG